MKIRFLLSLLISLFIASPLIAQEAPWNTGAGALGGLVNFDRVKKSGKASASITDTDSSSESGAIKGGEIDRSREEAGIHLYGGDATTDTLTSYNAKFMFDALGNSMYTSAYSVGLAALALTQQDLFGASTKGYEISQKEAQMLLQQEAKFIQQLLLLPNGVDKFREYAACKKAHAMTKEGGGGPVSPGDPPGGSGDYLSNFEVTKKCLGGFKINQPSVSETLTVNRNTVVKPQDDRDKPYSLKDIEGQFNDPESPPQRYAELGDEDREAKEYPIWSYITHDWNDVEEKLRFFNAAHMIAGTAILSEFVLNPDELGEVPDSVRGGVSAETAEHLVATFGNVTIEKSYNLLPPTRNVVFWGANESKTIELSGYQLLKATILQDVYGSLYALMNKLCIRENRLDTWSRSPSGGGYSNACPTWEATIEDDWAPESCELLEGGGAILPAGTEDIWPSQENVGWGGSRFYENADNNDPIPNLHQLLGNLRAGNTIFSHRDVYAMLEILRYEGGEGDAALLAECDTFVESAGLGDIIHFTEDPDTGATKFATSAWPLRTEYVFEGEETPLSKRIQLFYKIALMVAEYRTLENYEQLVTDVKTAESKSKRNWGGIFEIAYKLLKNGILGIDGSYGSKKSETLMSLVKARESIYEHLREVNSGARLSDMVVGSKQANSGATMAGF